MAEYEYDTEEIAIETLEKMVAISGECREKAQKPWRNYCCQALSERIHFDSPFNQLVPSTPMGLRANGLKKDCSVV
jgi:hypothetical protein